MSTYQSPYTEVNACLKCAELKAEILRLQGEVKTWRTATLPFATRGLNAGF